MANASKKDTGVVSIHGKEYLTVARRINDFREKHPDYAIQTELVSASDEVVVVKATISSPTGVIATGYAEEYRAASKINKTSALENAETSAVGRALAFFGMGGTEIASADEVAGAIQQQDLAPMLEYMDCVRENIESIAQIKASLSIDDYTYVAQLWMEMEPKDLELLWKAPSKGGVFTTQERAKLKSDEFSAARKANV